MLESARIMKRRSGEVNTPHARRARVSIVACVAMLALATTACDGRERRADRLWRQALERVEKGETQAGVDLLQKIIDDYPDTPIAAKARDQIVVYRGLAHAVQSYPSRRAHELMVQISRAIEAYKSETHRAPPRLEDLVPGKLASIPADPWGHPFAYEADGRGYRLRCLGADGAVGGSDEAEDLLVVNGDFTAAAP